MYSKKQINKYKRKSLEYYAKVGVPMNLDFIRVIDNLIIYQIEFLPGTTESKIRQYLKDASLMLKVQLFQLHREGMDLFLVVAKEKMINNSLLRIITNPRYKEYTKDMRIPYSIGYNVLGRPVIVDLVEYIHWLFGGSSNSGKTVGVKCLITDVICSCSPEDVNLIIYDGASNLIQFDGTPHLVGDVMQCPESGFKVVSKLYEEMERRIALKNEDSEKFHRHPFIICVLDEFISFIASVSDRNMAKCLTNMVSQLLRRGRHAKIHMVLAAQDPLIKDMKCDIGNASSRLGFTCAKSNYSMTILGESGAQNLSGDGEMYFKSNKHTGLEYIKGAYISPDEIEMVCEHIRAKYQDASWDSSYKFMVDDEGFEKPHNVLNNVPVLTEQEIEDRLFAEIIMWTLKRKEVSALQLKNAFNMGWPRANEFLDRLHEIGIVSARHGKLPRNVLFACVEDLPENVIGFLNSLGYTSADEYALVGSSQSGYELSITEIKSVFNEANRAIKIVQDIALHTNLLVLDAATETDKFGKHGKNYRVVLDEVRESNVKCRDAAEDVSNLLTNLNNKFESYIRITGPNAEVE